MLQEERKQRRVTGDESGFTLVELLIVIVILGILTAVVVFSITGLRNSGNVAACKAQVKTTEAALEAYQAKMGTYPGYGGVATAAPQGTSTPTASKVLTINEARDVLLHLTADQPPTGATPIAASARVKVLKSVPAIGGLEPTAPWVAGTPPVPINYTLATLGSPVSISMATTAYSSSVISEGSFMTLYWAIPSTAVGGITSAEIQVHGWYVDGGIVKTCMV